MHPSLFRARNRRGVLLLLVLSALTMFMMLGALMLTLATRARTSARAFAEAASTEAAKTIQSQAVLDEALLVLLRGSQQPLPPQITESLLADRYGPATTGTAVEASVVPYSSPQLRAGAIVTATVRGFAPTIEHPCDLNGRVLTLKPNPGDGDIASYRILRTTGEAEPFTVYLAPAATNRRPVLPKKACTVIVNGSEFLAEAHDAFDVDAWLARVELVNSQVSTVPRATYAAPGASLACDNDNDGIADGIWIDGTTGLLPDRPSPLGGTLKYRVSYHVLDLDGRINLNAHGSLVAATTGTADWLPTSQGVSIGGIPPGLGYGPADVDGSRLLGADDTPGVPGHQSRRLTSLLVRGTAAVTGTVSTGTQRRTSPAIGTPVEGRYGWVVSGAVSPPGRPGAAVSAVARSSLEGRSPTDLNARVRAFLKPGAAVAPQLVFYLPDRNQSDFVEDPYQIRLDVDGPLGAVVRQPAAKAATRPADNPFTVSEMERLLRQFDADASALPPRLATVLDEFAQRSRMTLSTDTWDTPAMTGQTLADVRYYLRQFPPPTSIFSDAPVYGAISPDVSAGLRFDVNRSFDVPSGSTATLQEVKERFCRHLFTLLSALDPNHARCTQEEKAQWAVNVCDFRDSDSTMTLFPYDTNPLDGWSTTTASPTVIGAERPELVITEAIAWAGHASVVLHHPWNAVLTDKTNGTTPTEMVDDLLKGTGTNTLLLAKTHNGAASGSPIWKLRFEGGGTADFKGASATTCTLAADESICVQTADPLAATVAKKLAVAAFVPGPPGPGTLILERLADPTKANDETPTSTGYNPYVRVDEAVVAVYPDQTAAQTAERSSTDGFWKSSFTTVAKRAPGNYPKKAPWFHWPNRPFVSVGELALVPKGNARDMLAGFVQPKPGTPFPSLAAIPGLGLLDAVHVPSRFVGTSRSVGLQASGTWPLRRSVADVERVCIASLPTWREPGRVNVNTIARNTGNTNPLLEDGVWKALAGDAAPVNPFNSGDAGTAAASVTKLLSLAAAADKPPLAESPTAPRDQDPFFVYATAIRLANVATIRSHVFAIWITLETTDTSPGAGPPSTRRLFAIVDRSIPVGFREGENLNVRDTIRLQRYLE